MIKIDKVIYDSNDNIIMDYFVKEVVVKPSDQQLSDFLNEAADHINLKTEDISSLEPIEYGRKLYRALGKDPSRYRLSSDSLLRRIIKGKGLYFINNIVDLGNYISFTTGYPVGIYDFDKIEGEIEYRVGRDDDDYEGIGRGVLNVEGLPLLSDEKGPFGSSTSDTERTMVKIDTKRILFVIYGFDGNKINISNALNKMEKLISEF